MANYYASARTNYVTIVNREGLTEALKHFSAMEWADSDGKTAFLVTDDDCGAFPSYASWTDEEGNSQEAEFSWAEHVMPYVAEGEVLVIMEVGAEKLRYLVGVAEAYLRRGKKIRRTYINLNDIYTKAAKTFKTTIKEISVAEY